MTLAAETRAGPSKAIFGLAGAIRTMAGRIDTGAWCGANAIGAWGGANARAAMMSADIELSGEVWCLRYSILSERSAKMAPMLIQNTSSAFYFIKFIPSGYGLRNVVFSFQQGKIFLERYSYL